MASTGSGSPRHPVAPPTTIGKNNHAPLVMVCTDGSLCPAMPRWLHGSGIRTFQTSVENAPEEWRRRHYPVIIMSFTEASRTRCLEAVRQIRAIADREELSLGIPHGESAEVGAPSSPQGPSLGLYCPLRQPYIAISSAGIRRMASELEALHHGFDARFDDLSSANAVKRVREQLAERARQARMFATLLCQHRRFVSSHVSAHNSHKTVAKTVAHACTPSVNPRHTSGAMVFEPDVRCVAHSRGVSGPVAWLVACGRLHGQDRRHLLSPSAKRPKLPLVSAQTTAAANSPLRAQAG